MLRICLRRPDGVKRRHIEIPTHVVHTVPHSFNDNSTSLQVRPTVFVNRAYAISYFEIRAPCFSCLTQPMRYRRMLLPLLLLSRASRCRGANSVHRVH